MLTGTAAIYARESVLLAKYPDMVPVKIQALRIGDIGIVAIPCEVFTEIGLEIKKSSPLKHTFTIELANGYNGYLPTPAQHAPGRLRDLAGAVELSGSGRVHEGHGGGERTLRGSDEMKTAEAPAKTNLRSAPKRDRVELERR